MTELDLDAIEAGAKAATPGPWRRVPQKGYPDDYVVTDHPDHQGTGDFKHLIAEVGLASGQVGHPYMANSAHIARMDPENTLLMVERIRELERLVAYLKHTGG